MSVLELENTGKHYRRPGHRVIALDGVTLRVENGEFLAVQGASGSGKTTLLLSAGALLAPDTGRVLLDGQDIFRLPAGRRARLRAEKIGFIFQQFHLVPYLDCLDNVLAPAMALGESGANDRAREMLEKLNLANRLRHLPGELSTGERQRVALARALINKPSLLLADEPTGNLDEKNGALVLEYLSAFTADGGAVLLVTHSRETAARARRVIHLEEGRVIGEMDNCETPGITHAEIALGIIRSFVGPGSAPAG